MFRTYKLYLRDPNRRWLYNMKHNFTSLLEKLKNDQEFIHRPSLANPIESEKFMTHNWKSIPVKYTNLIKLILTHFECRGIWAEDMVFDQIYTTVEVFGYPEDLELCMNVINYYVQGIQHAQVNIQTEQRRLKINARRSKKQTVSPKNARTFANDFVIKHLKDLERFISKHPLLNSFDRKTKMDNIFKHINQHKKIDLKHYKKLSKATIYSSTARIGSRHINRLV